MKIKMFMFAALAAFATLAGCSDDENNDGTGGGGTEDKPVPSEYEVEFKSTSYYLSLIHIFLVPGLRQVFNFRQKRGRS